MRSGIPVGRVARTKTKRWNERERKHSERIIFPRNLREIVILNGANNLVYLDESGFEEYIYRPYGWSKPGQKTYGDRNGKRGTRTSLIAGKRGKELLARPSF